MVCRFQIFLALSLCAFDSNVTYIITQDAIRLITSISGAFQWLSDNYLWACCICHQNFCVHKTRSKYIQYSEWMSQILVFHIFPLKMNVSLIEIFRMKIQVQVSINKILFRLDLCSRYKCST